MLIFNFISSNVLSVFNTEASPLGFLGGVQSPIISPSYLAYDVQVLMSPNLPNLNDQAMDTVRPIYDLTDRSD